MLQKSKRIWDVNVDDIVIWKLVKITTNSKYFFGYLDKFKMREYVKTFKVKNVDKDKNIKLMSFLIDDESLLKK